MSGRRSIFEPGRLAQSRHVIPDKPRISTSREAPGSIVKRWKPPMDSVASPDDGVSFAKSAWSVMRLGEIGPARQPTKLQTKKKARLAPCLL